MRLPKRIDIGLAVIHVQTYTKEEMRVECEVAPDAATPEGFWDTDEDVIGIGRWLPAKRKREVLFHELVHAMLDFRESLSCR